MTNLELANSVVLSLRKEGVSEICLCSGARNAPLVEAFKSFEDLSIHSFFDERAASFFALGRAQATGRPVVVCTTSGTAVTELISGAVEAYYDRLPLVLLTADRPSSYRGSGAPQSIDQLQPLMAHVDKQIQIERTLGSFEISQKGPTHINVCFDEPLLGERVERLTAPETKLERPLLIVSGLSTIEARELEPILSKIRRPMILEPTSQLSGSPNLQSFQVSSHSVQVAGFLENFDSVIRIGSVPTARVFRDLDLALDSVPVLTFSNRPWPGLSRLPKSQVQPLKAFAEQKFDFQDWEGVPAKGQEEKVQRAIEAFEKSELNIFRKLKSQIPSGAKVFLGNSLPIREWEAAGDFVQDHKYEFFGQRGVNGIDGLVSRFLGQVESGRENVLILGDLSFLYDSSGLWAQQFLPERVSFKIFVINNFGGRIFRRLFKNTKLQTEHNLNMKLQAEYWGLYYQSVGEDEVSSFNWNDLPEVGFVEFFPELDQSDKAWEALKAIYV